MHANVLEAPSHRQQDIPARGAAAVNHTVSFLDWTIPLKGASHNDVVRYDVVTIWRNAECIATLGDGRKIKLRDKWQFVGYTGNNPVRRLLFCSNGSHVEVRIDSDELVVAVEAHDTGFSLHKQFASVKRTLAALFTSNGDSLIRVLNCERTYTAVDGSLVSPAD